MGLDAGVVALTDEAVAGPVGLDNEDAERVPFAVGEDAMLLLTAADADNPVVAAECVPLGEEVGKVLVWLPVADADTFPFKVADGVM